MPDLKSSKLMYAKAIGFILIGLLASILILLDSPNLRTLILLSLAVWAFARAYYFAFYVVQHYIDPDYRFAGIISAVRHLGARFRIR